MGITRVYAGVVGTGCGIDDPHSIDITRVYAGIVGAKCGDRGSPHCRRPLPAYTQVLRMFCMWGSSIATVPTAITRVYAGVRAHIVDRHQPRIRRCCGWPLCCLWGSTIPAVSTPTSRVYAGVLGARNSALLTAITRVYAGIADALYAGINGEKRTDCVC